MPSEPASPKPRVTQTNVARVAGVHNTTVSLALRNCPSIPEATRKRIRAIADDLGYYPDPTLQALVAYRKGRMAPRPRNPLAFVTDAATCWGWRAQPAAEGAYLGAQRKAAELGYQLEHFWLGETGMTPRRLSGIFYHRGITGAILAASRAEDGDLNDLDWSRLSGVQLGCFPRQPALHRVTDDHTGIIRRVVQRVRAAGFTRPGLVMTDAWDASADQAWSSGFLAEQNRLPTSTRLPVLSLASAASPSSETANLAQLDRWYRSHRPDAILGFSPAVLGQLESLGLSIPQDLAYVDLGLASEDRRVAGVRLNSETAGEVAATLLVGQLQQNLCGLPAVPTTTLVDGTWQDGATLPTRLAKVATPGRIKLSAPAAEPVWLASA